MDKNMEIDKNKCKILAIIPARGGSKGIPGKNIAELGGKPLIAWTIDEALKSKYIDKIIVSTDDQKIANCAEKCGIPVPWLRPDELAGDDAPVIMAMIDALERLKKDEDYYPDYVLLLQVTVPLRSCEDMDNGIKLAIEKSADSVVSVCETQEHPYLGKKIDKNGYLLDFLEIPLPEMQKNRQNFPAAYFLNGAIYLIKTELLLKQKSLYGNKSYAYVMPHERSMDIDSLWDLHVVRLIMADRLKTSEQ